MLQEFSGYGVIDETTGYGVEVDVENSNAKIVVINTCGFIGDAKEESINTILEQVERKQEGEVEKIYVMGCLSQRYDQDLKKEIPEVDAYFGKFDWKGILAELGKSYDEKLRNERTHRLTNSKQYVPKICFILFSQITSVRGDC